MKESRKKSDNMRTRQCAVTRDMLSIDQLIRFVETPDGIIIPDIKADLPGRGVWVICQRDKVSRAIDTGVFARSLKKKVSVDPALADQLDDLLLKCALQRLSLATKAGLVTKGFVKVAKRLEKGGFIALMHATDGAPDGKRKLDAILKKTTSVGDETESFTAQTIEVLSITELSLATGGENVVHAAIKEGGASTGFFKDLTRLMKYRGI